MLREIVDEHRPHEVLLEEREDPAHGALPFGREHREAMSLVERGELTEGDRSSVACELQLGESARKLANLLLREAPVGALTVGRAAGTRDATSPCVSSDPESGAPDPALQA